MPITHDDNDDVVLKGGTDATPIGNTGDALHTEIRNSTPIPVETELKATAFGELATQGLAPYIALEATGGIKSRSVETFISGTGATTTVLDNAPGREFCVTSGTTQGGYGVLRSKKTLSYRPGIGSLGRFTARFSTPVAGGVQRAGFFNIGNELTVGYDGTQFGVLRKTGGRPEIRKLTINTASNQSTDVTVTLDGVTYTASVTNASAEVNAYEIATSTAYPGWNVYNRDNTVIFQSNQTTTQTGTYSAVPDSGNFSGVFTQLVAGTAGTLSWTYQANWSETTLTSGSDPFVLDPSKGNVFQIQYQYLGYGQIVFSIENPNTGKFIPVHKIKYTNQNVTPSIDLPQFKLGIIAANTTNTTSVETYSASLAGFHENTVSFPLNVSAVDGSQGGVGTTLTNILAVKKTTINGNELLDIADVELDDLTVAADATKPVFFELRLNPTFADEVLWQEPASQSPMVYTATGGDVTGGTLIYAIAVSRSSNLRISLKELDVILSNDDVLSIAAKTTSGSADIAAALVWGNG